MTQDSDRDSDSQLDSQTLYIFLDEGGNFDFSPPHLFGSLPA